jgi:hypothetical protein
MSAVKRHPTDAVILDVLSKTEIDPKNFPVILEGLKKERLQTEIAKDYGMTQMNVSRLLVLAKKRLKENLHAGIWVEFEEGRLPISMVRKLGAFAKQLDENQNDETKRKALKVMDAALVEIEQILSAPDQAS